jgi:hypothetical protein
MKLSEIKIGHAYKYNGKWGMAGLWDEKIILYPAGTVSSPEYFAPNTSYNVEITEEVAEAITEEWGQPEVIVPVSDNSPQAKHLALDAALQYSSHVSMSSRDIDKSFVDLAEEIYQWLIKSEE